MELEKLLQGYIDANGKFYKFPGKKQKAKQEAMLLALAKKFKLNVRYSETEVNEILNQYHSFNDPATLRRLMFGKKLIDRTIDGKAYWLVKDISNQ